MRRRPSSNRLDLVAIASLAVGLAVSGCQGSTTSTSNASVAPTTSGTAAASSAPVTPRPTQTPVPGFADWQVINPGSVKISVDDGALVMRLTAHALWFNRDKGVLFYRDVTGDFRADATVRTSKASDPSMPPGQDGTVQLAGLMARAEVPTENYVFIVSGSIGNSTGLETKTTESSQSIYIQRGLPTGGDAELRLCRIGTTFYLWWRHADSKEDWTHMSTLDRKDLPATLQVGANIYTDASPDIVARFENLTIEALALGAAC
jgi:hypothetical protein